ncbi:MAG: hypothetical protein ACTSRZ_09870 [Promethearchaeota archaeon]
MEKVIDEYPEVHVENFNGDNVYLSDKNSNKLNEHEIINNIAPRKTSSRKSLKKGKINGKLLKVFSGSWSNALVCRKYRFAACQTPLKTSI